MFANCQERGQWVMAYVDSNHGASVNDVESLGWNLSLRQGCPGSPVYTLQQHLFSSRSICCWVLDGDWWLLLITYNLSLLLTTVYQVIWLRAIVKSCVSPSILWYCSMVAPLYFPHVVPLFADLSKGNMGLSDKKVPRNLDGRSVDHRSYGPYPETVKNKHQFGIPMDIIDRYIKTGLSYMDVGQNGRPRT